MILLVKSLACFACSLKQKVNLIIHIGCVNVIVDCGNTKIVAGASLNKGSTKTCGCRRKQAAVNRLSLTGCKFGKLIVADFSYEKKNKSHWLCKCDCGKFKVIIGSSLISGNTKSCGSCGKLAYNRRGFAELSGGYWSHVKHNCKLRKKRQFNITEEEAWAQFLAQNRKCAISGVELCFARNYIKNPKSQTASLDRIDSTKDYVIDNIQWVHKIVNKMKNNLSDCDLIAWCKTITENNEGHYGEQQVPSRGDIQGEGLGEEAPSPPTDGLWSGGVGEQSSGQPCSNGVHKPQGD